MSVMNLDVDKDFVIKSLGFGGGLIVISFALQVVFHLLTESGLAFGGTMHVLWLTFANLLLWIGALASVPGLVALGVAAARPRQ